MNLTQEEINALNLISLDTNLDYGNLKDFFQGLLYHAVICQEKGTPVIIPFLGKLEIEYEGRTFVKDGAKANLKTKFKPSKNLIKNIGQIKNDELLDIEKWHLNNFNNAIRKKYSEDEID